MPKLLGHRDIVFPSLVHGFHISYSHTEWNLLTSLCNDSKIFFKWSAVTLNYCRDFVFMFF